MEQIRTHKRVTHTRRQPLGRSSRRQQQKKRLLLFGAFLFFLGLLLGFFLGSRSQQAIAFSPEAFQHISKSKDTKGQKEASIDNSKLPWNLQLVNFEYPLTENFQPESLSEVDNGYKADSRIVDALKKMIADARETADVRIIAISAYRDYDYQMNLFENKVQRLQQEYGYSVSKAREEAATVVAYPGTSEHQLGLALDLVDAHHVELDESQEDTDAYQWLSKHCADYGFIVRYPNGKTDITGIIYEPWHFRYVGKEAAKVIMEKDITLEEYLADYYEY